MVRFHFFVAWAACATALQFVAQGSRVLCMDVGHIATIGPEVEIVRCLQTVLVSSPTSMPLFQFSHGRLELVVTKYYPMALSLLPSGTLLNEEDCINVTLNCVDDLQL